MYKRHIYTRKSGVVSQGSLIEQATVVALSLSPKDLLNGVHSDTRLVYILYGKERVGDRKLASSCLPLS